MNAKSDEISITQRLARAKVEDFNDAQAEALAERMLDTLNSAARALLISVGHRTKLFDVMAKIHPATSEQIAQAARLNERYVREWLRLCFWIRSCRSCPAWRRRFVRLATNRYGTGSDSDRVDFTSDGFDRRLTRSLPVPYQGPIHI
jgi:hypothetical protein